MSNEEELFPVFVPSLASVLHNYQRQKGSPLTESEVVAIRDKCTVVMLLRSAAEQMAQRRGYEDIDPENCWHEWQKIRANFSDDAA